MAARPYPYERWPHVSKHDASCIRSASRALPVTELCQRARAEATTVLGAQVSGFVAAIESWPKARARAALSAPLCALWLEFAVGARTLPVVCELPSEFGAALVDRVLGGDGATAHPVGATLDDLSCGVLAYLAARVCAALGADLRVRAVLDDPERALSLLDDERVLVLPLGVEVADIPRGRLRLWISQADAAQLTAAGARRGAGVPRAWRALPMTLCADAGVVRLRAQQVRELGAGDVLIPDQCSLARGATGFAGAVALRVLGSRRQCFHATAHDREIALEALEPWREATMTDAKRIDTQAIADAPVLAGDTPIELCLELARFTLPLEELSALRPGEVLNTRRPIGEQVSLTAGGRTFARGELVELDGEVGVRIVELVR